MEKDWGFRPRRAKAALGATDFTDYTDPTDLCRYAARLARGAPVHRPQSSHWGKLLIDGLHFSTGTGWPLNGDLV